MVVAHLIVLHVKGSRNPLGLKNRVDKVSFHPYFTVKDIVTVLIFLWSLMFVVRVCPLMLNDPENYIPANPISTPAHIKPEWYYLFAYAILRSIPRKVGGVVALVGSISIFGILPFIDRSNFLGISFYPHMKTFYWLFIFNLFLLT